jgi:hypothetical protein
MQKTAVHRSVDTSAGRWRDPLARLLRQVRPDRLQLRLMMIAVPVFLVELLFAWKTIGTYDIAIFKSFAKSVDRVGPIDIYNLPLGVAGLMVYNHAPLTGWWLMFVNAMQHLGIDPRTTIRAGNSIAHLATAFLVLAILRRRTSEFRALLGAGAVAVSPALAIIAGFHGNNDPSVAMFMVASAFFLVDRRWPVASGVAFAIGISIKIVPVVVLPVLLVAAWNLGRRRDLLRFAAGGLAIFALLWVPVLIGAPSGFLHNVLGYNGSGFPRQWGFYEIGSHLLHLPQGLLNIYSGPGAYLVIAISSLLPAWLVRRQPQRAPAALGLSLILFLLLTPAWAPQYTAYAAAVVLLVDFWSGIAFTVVGGLGYLVLYIQWRSQVEPLTQVQTRDMLLVWLAIMASAVMGVRSLLRTRFVNQELGRVPRQVEPGARVADEQAADNPVQVSSGRHARPEPSSS